MFRNNNFSLIETEASKKLVFICSMKLKKNILIIVLLKIEKLISIFKTILTYLVWYPECRFFIKP